MYFTLRFLSFFVCILLVSIDLKSQSPRVYLNDFRVHWLKDNDAFWYRKDLKDSREFVLVDALSGEKRLAFNQDEVAQLINISPENLSIAELEFSDQSDAIQLYTVDGQGWQFNPETNEVQKLPGTSKRRRGIPADTIIGTSYYGSGSTTITFLNKLDRTVFVYWVTSNGERILYHKLEPNQKKEQGTAVGHFWLVTEQQKDTSVIAAFRAEKHAGTAFIDEDVPVPVEPKKVPQEKTVLSPDNRYEAFVRDNNLWIRNIVGGDEVKLSDDGSDEFTYRRDAIRARTMWMQYDKADYPRSLPEVYWSEDSRKLIALRTKVVPEPRIYLKSSGDEEPESYPYLRPGAEIPEQDVHLFDIEMAKEIPVDQAKWPNQWRLSMIGWKKDSFRILYNQRGHQVLRLLEIDGSTGKVSTLIEERNDTFIDYSFKYFMQEINNGDEILWMSERDGWNHLYVYDANQGGDVQQITKGNWAVRYIDHVDEGNGVVWFWAGGIYPEQDPYYLHLCRAQMDGSGWEVLTEGNGNHSIEWSPDSVYFIDTWSRVDQPPIHELRKSSDGSLVMEIERADASELLASGYRFPRTYEATGRDDSTQIYGIIHFPTRFDSTKSYPVVEAIYAGPHGSHVPKSFNPRPRTPGNLGNHGYVVVQIDGMGTSNRSKAFHDVAWKNIKDAGFPDRIRWIRSAAESRSWMDLDRVGIFGGSAGGQNAMRAVIDYANFYKAAAADCGCHDNRLDKIWWNEAWMGWPVDDAYVSSSNLEDAHKLKGKLLLTVGVLDKNVPPESTYKVVEALEKASKDFEYLPIEGFGHGAGDTQLGLKKRVEFFNKHLKNSSDN